MQRSGGLLLILIGRFCFFGFFANATPPTHTHHLIPPLNFACEIYRWILEPTVRWNDFLLSGLVSRRWSGCHRLLTPRWEMRIRHTCPTPDHTKTPNPTAPSRTPRRPTSASRTYRYIYWTTKPALCGFFFSFFFDKIVLLFKMETPQNFSSKCTNTKAGGLSSIAFMSLPLPSL